MTTQERVDQATLEDLIADYKRRFTDIKDIFVNKKKKTTVVVLKNGIKGIVKPCKGEIVDERIGILEAYIKSKDTSKTIEDFKRKHKVVIAIALFKLKYATEYEEPNQENVHVQKKW